MPGAGTRAWAVKIDAPLVLNQALYLHHAARLENCPVEGRLLNAEAIGTEPVVVDGLGEVWDGWWEHVLGATIEHARDIDSDFARLRRFRDVVVSTEAWPAVAAGLDAVKPGFLRWWRETKPALQPAAHLPVRDIVHRFQRRVRRPARPFLLTISIVGVEGLSGLMPSDADAVLTQGWLRDAPAWKEWFSDRVAVLA